MITFALGVLAKFSVAARGQDSEILNPDALHYEAPKHIPTTVLCILENQRKVVSSQETLETQGVCTLSSNNLGIPRVFVRVARKP